MRLRILALACVLPVLAGCTGPVEEAPAASPPWRVIAPQEFASLPFLEVDHDHTDPLLHQDAIAGWTLTAHLPLEQDRGTGYQAEIDLMGDVLAVAFGQNPGGVTLVDVSNPDQPRRLSYIALDDVVVADVKLAPDGRTMFVGTSSWLLLGGQVERLDNGPERVTTLADAFGVVVYDISDPARPVHKGMFPVGRDGVHMLDVHIIDGDLYVFATTPFYSLHVLATMFLPVGSPENGVEILRWDGQWLLPVSRYDAPEKVGYDFAHDITVVDDGDQVLLLTGYVFGAAMADVTDPAQPRHLGSFVLADAGIEESDAHTVMMDYVEGRRVLVTTPEWFGAREVLTIDASDPARLSLIGRWALPDRETRQEGGWAWSPHNVNVWEGRAYLAHYHAGAWVLDIGNASALAQPQVLAYFAPAGIDHAPSKNFLIDGYAPNTWDVLPGKGRVFVSDIGSGLYVLKPGWSIGEGAPYGTRGA